jgi:hypothetical protein
MKINEIEKRHPVELEDPGTIEVQGYGDQRTASVINMQVNNVGPKSNLAVFVNANFELTWESGDRSVGVGKGWLSSLEEYTVDVQSILDEMGTVTDIREVSKPLAVYLNKQVTQFLTTIEDQIAQHADESN